MAQDKKTEIFTITLTDTTPTFTITEDDGISNLSVYCSTATAATILGTRKVAGVASGAISITQGLTVTITTIGYAMDNIVITIPSGCSVDILAS